MNRTEAGQFIYNSTAQEISDFFGKKYIAEKKDYLAGIAISFYKKSDEFKAASRADKNWFLACQRAEIYLHLMAALKLGAN